MTSMLFETYRHYLWGEFERRKVRNPFYSLRAFARDLGVAPSRLSEALNARRGISSEMAELLIKKLAIEDFDAEVFRVSVEAEHARSPKQRQAAKKTLTALLARSSASRPLTATLVDWIADAVLKMSERENVIDSPDKIAHKLGVPQFMVVGALRFLTRLGLMNAVKPFRTYLPERGVGRRLNVDYSQILEQAQKAHKAHKAGRSSADLFCHEALLLEAKDLPKARRLVQECFGNLKILEKKTKAAKVTFAALQIFSVEVERKES